MFEAYSLWRPALLPLCLRASARTGQNHSTVLFQDSAITSGKNSENREQKQTCLHSAEVHPVFAELQNHRPLDSKTDISHAQLF